MIRDDVPLPTPMSAAPAFAPVRRLFPPHHDALLASAIRDEVIKARGYWTATSEDLGAVRRLGHSPEIVRGGAALMIPLWDVHGAVAFTVARPDVPRVDSRGKPRKYETPRAAKLTLDVNPLARPALQAADTPVWIAEGLKKADAALSAGAGCAIALVGVWSWKRHAIPAWDAVHLRDRSCYLAFDSDCQSNARWPRRCDGFGPFS